VGTEAGTLIDCDVVYVFVVTVVVYMNSPPPLELNVMTVWLIVPPVIADDCIWLAEIRVCIIVPATNAELEIATPDSAPWFTLIPAG
jgi:hypothetical protein